MQLCMECSHLCKQHHLECVNILPETVNNSMQLCFSFLFFEAFCTNKLLINKREHNLVAFYESVSLESCFTQNKALVNEMNVHLCALSLMATIIYVFLSKFKF